jgi:hypothetical protein
VSRNWLNIRVTDWRGQYLLGDRLIAAGYTPSARELLGGAFPPSTRVIAKDYRQWSGTAPEFQGRQQTERLHIAFGYSAGMGEVLAGSTVRPELHAGSRLLRGSLHFRNCTVSEMSNVIHHSKLRENRITWPAQQRAAHWEQQREGIAHALGAALKWYF